MGQVSTYQNRMERYETRTEQNLEISDRLVPDLAWIPDIWPDILDADQLQRFHHLLTMSQSGILSGHQIIQLGPLKCILEQDVGMLPILDNEPNDR